MATNIYLIVNKDGKFLNLSKKDSYYFADKLFHGSYGLSEKKVQAMINALPESMGLSLFQSTNLEFEQELATTTTALVIKLDSIQVELERIRYSLPTMPGLDKSLANFLKNASNKLKVINPRFKDFLEHKEDATYEVASLYEEFIDEISKIGMWEVSEGTALFKSWRLDRRTMLGMVNKVLKLNQKKN